MKSRIKRLVMNLYCRGLLPARAVAFLFSKLNLASE